MAKNKEEAVEAVAPAKTGEGPRKRENPLTNENQTHVDVARFCWKEHDVEQFTDNVHVAYAAIGRGCRVIDHHHGNREYDGKIPNKG